mgnify:FL=1
MASDKAYNKIESIVMERVFSLENENAQLKNDLAIARAKLDVYERLANISGDKTQLGFGPPIDR